MIKMRGGQVDVTVIDDRIHSITGDVMLSGAITGHVYLDNDLHRDPEAAVLSNFVCCVLSCQNDAKNIFKNIFFSIGGLDFS